VTEQQKEIKDMVDTIDGYWEDSDKDFDKFNPTLERDTVNKQYFTGGFLAGIKFVKKGGIW
jgi:hypothetical protein